VRGPLRRAGVLRRLRTRLDARLRLRQGSLPRQRAGQADRSPHPRRWIGRLRAPDAKRLAWVELRTNVVFGTFDYRRYVANADGSSPRQVAASGGRPFVAFYDASRIEGLTGGRRRHAGGRALRGDGDERDVPRRRRRAASRLRRGWPPPAPSRDVAGPRPARRDGVHVRREHRQCDREARSDRAVRRPHDAARREPHDRAGRQRPGVFTPTASGWRSRAAHRSGPCRRRAAPPSGSWRAGPSARGVVSRRRETARGSIAARAAGGGRSARRRARSPPCAG
jgi:hypothetical protein